MANVTEKEIIEKYQELAEELQEELKKDPKLMVVDTESIKKFCRGLGECELDKGYFDWHNTAIDCHNGINIYYDDKELYEPEKEDIWKNQTVVRFTNKSMAITNYDKTATLWNPMLAYKNLEEKSQYAFNDSVTPHAFYMTEVTEDGYYRLYLDQHNPGQNQFQFYSNADILDSGHLVAREEDVERTKYDLAHGNVIYYRFLRDGLYAKFGEARDGKISLPSISCAPKDFVLLANKIYRKGLPYVANLAKMGEVLEITDEDRKFYEDMDEISQENTSAREKQTSTQQTDISNLEEAIASLRHLKSMGIELTSSQEDLVNAYDRLIGKLNSQKFMWYYEKLNSDEFEQYKDSTQEREERLQAVREDIASREGAKEEWYASPENPSNIKDAQMQTMTNQLDALNNVSTFMPLADAQEDSRKELETFFDMKEQADAEDHTLDSTMSDDIRTWYQDEYGKQETGGKAK